MNVYEEISEASRRHIMQVLLSGPKSVSELVDATGLKQPNVSNHLARLRMGGMVRANKIGRQVFYSLGSSEIEDAVRNFVSKEISVQDVDLAEISKEYARAAVRGDELECGRLVETVLKSGQDIVSIYQDFLGNAMSIIGTWYKVDAIDEAQEHMASEITQRMMSRASAFYGVKARTERSAILGCAPGTWHVIGLRMLSDYLVHVGWRAQFIGANVPVESFVANVRDSKPDLVLVSCAAMESIDPTIDLIQQLNSMRGRKMPYVIGVGGPSVHAHPEVFQRAGADFTSRDLRSFVETSLPEIERVGRASGNWREANLDGFKRNQTSNEMSDRN